MHTLYDARKDPEAQRITEVPKRDDWIWDIYHAKANRGELNPLVLQYRQSYIAMAYIPDYYWRHNGKKQLHTSIFIPRHQYTSEEPWTDRIRYTSGGNDMVAVLRMCVEFIGAAECLNYDMVWTLKTFKGVPRRYAIS